MCTFNGDISPGVREYEYRNALVHGGGVVRVICYGAIGTLDFNSCTILNCCNSLRTFGLDHWALWLLRWQLLWFEWLDWNEINNHIANEWIRVEVINIYLKHKKYEKIGFSPPVAISNCLNLLPLNIIHIS